MKKVSFLLAALALCATVLTAVPVAAPANAPAQTQVQPLADEAQPMTKADVFAPLEARPVCNLLCAIDLKCCIVRGQPACVPITQNCRP